MDAPAPTKRKRGIRDSSNAIIGPLSSRQMHALQIIEQFSLTDIYHLAYLTNTSHWNWDNTVQELLDSGYIDHLGNNLYERDRLNDPLVYTRTEKGRAHLETAGRLPHRALWLTSGGSAPHNLKAALLVQRLAADFQRAGYRFIPFEEDLSFAPPQTQTAKRPWRFYFPQTLRPVPHDKPLHHIEPDAIFSIADENDYRRLFFFELDVSDHGTDKYKKKAQDYHDLIFQAIYKKQYGMTQYAAVITVTDNPTRYQKMLAATPPRDPQYYKLIPHYGQNMKTPKPADTTLTEWQSPSETITLTHLIGEA